jgi:hypothetical protein
MSLVIFTEDSVKFKNDDNHNDEKILVVKNIVNRETKQSSIHISDSEGFELIYNSTFKINSKKVNSFFESMNSEDKSTITSKFNNILHSFSSGLMCYYALILIIEHGYKIPFDVKLEEPITTTNKFKLVYYILDSLYGVCDPVLVKLIIFVRNFINTWGSLFPEGCINLEESKVYSQINRGLLSSFNKRLNLYQYNIESMKNKFKNDIDTMINDASVTLEKTYRSFIDRSINDLSENTKSLCKNMEYNLYDKLYSLNDKIEKTNRSLLSNKSDFSIISNDSSPEENDILNKSRFKRHFTGSKSSKSIIRKFI